MLASFLERTSNSRPMRPGACSPGLRGTLPAVASPGRTRSSLGCARSRSQSLSTPSAARIISTTPAARPSCAASGSTRAGSSRGLSRHSSANNHLVGELMGLLAVGLLAPELAASEGWAAEASAEIAAQALLQVLPDGGGAEQSFAYEVFVLDMLLIATALLDARGRAVPPAMTDALRRAGGALALLLDDDEPDPAFGDADDGRALRLDGRPDRDARGVAAGIAARLGESGARRVARDCDAYVPLLFGSEGLTRFAATVPDAPARSGVLPDAGIVVIRDRRSACAVRCRIARLPQHRSARARRRALRRRLCRSRRARDGSGHGQLPRSHASELVPRHAGPRDGRRRRARPVGAGGSIPLDATR